MSITFLGLIAFLSIMVVSYSQYYMHREVGYQKFFACLLFLMFGLTLLTVAGTLDLLMAGWEFVGICSFLLIGFYQTRLSPVRNAFKVLSVYKFCDVGLLLGGWLSHLLWHDTQYFAVLNTASTRAHLADVGSWQLLLLTVMILVAAAGKSAQWPFSFWLSKAMEGPTPSSAIFYGSLSVHAGVLLLHRMHPIWSAAEYGPWLVGSLGLLTAIICTGIARVQSNIKGQIAYSSAANVGLIFLEMALNLKELAMLHMVANACLRCYQLLVSPSVMAYLVRLQGTTNQQLRPMGWSLERYIPPKLARLLYVFCINDGYLESVVYGLIWRPIKVVGSF
jgi:NADH:ubiquinone oxidoreductase subunit 5 (subunit L)/multisubunit Na+/H+ antiporter MnhA subunit